MGLSSFLQKFYYFILLQHGGTALDIEQNLNKNDLSANLWSNLQGCRAVHQVQIKTLSVKIDLCLFKMIVDTFLVIMIKSVIFAATEMRSVG